ncbi:uncharacterized protein V2V93DRAFT_384529 [Kockiozyma suomiensis]|uniref:uncharacterized protein n=1 Tax=Kockiozyma suomiensis TaxID=1337062 RepID=UPI0033436449
MTPNVLLGASMMSPAAATLWTAIRVKSSLIPKAWDGLEVATKEFTSTSPALVSQRRSVLQRHRRRDDEFEKLDHIMFSAHEFQGWNMEQYAEILKMENEPSL